MCPPSDLLVSQVTVLIHQETYLTPPKMTIPVRTLRYVLELSAPHALVLISTRYKVPGCRLASVMLVSWVSRYVGSPRGEVKVTWKVECRARSAAQATWKLVLVTLETVTVPRMLGTGQG